MSQVLVEDVGRVRRITVDHPQTRNSLTDAALADLVGAAEDAERSQEIRCVVLAGSDAVFASGADVRALLQMASADVESGPRQRLWTTFRGLQIPLVAAISGFCLGAGAELAMMSDIVVASETVRFGLPETALGLIPGAGGTQLLAHAAGKAVAMDVILSGRLLNAEELMRVGVVSRVASVADYRNLAYEIAATVAERPALAQRLAMQSVRRSFEVSLSEGLAAERRDFGTAFDSPDAKEGLTAFLEKRTAQFT